MFASVGFHATTGVVLKFQEMDVNQNYFILTYSELDYTRIHTWDRINYIKK